MAPVTGRITNADNEVINNASISVELYHTSTLIHDDIMDEDVLRRGKDTIFETMRKYFFNNLSEEIYKGTLFKDKSSRFAISGGIIAGNILDTLSVQPLVKSTLSQEKVTQSVRILSDCAKIINIGQMLDLLLETKKEVTENEYLDMIHRKTGQLFASSIQIGLILADASAEQLKLMEITPSLNSIATDLIFY